MVYTNENIKRLLEGKRYENEEDLLIMQDDGSRACVGWEMVNGYHLIKDFKKQEEMSDEALLSDAYKILLNRK